MDDRSANEAALFVRYEARIVALELRMDNFSDDCKHYWPIVDTLRDGALVAEQIATRLKETATLKLTKVHVAIALLALFVPAVVSSLLTYALLRATTR